jgi:hypothetical protein
MYLYTLCGFCVDMNANLEGSFFFSKIFLLEIFVSPSALNVILFLHSRIDQSIYEITASNVERSYLRGVCTSSTDWDALYWNHKPCHCHKKSHKIILKLQFSPRPNHKETPLSYTLKSCNIQHTFVPVYLILHQLQSFGKGTYHFVTVV